MAGPAASSDRDPTSPHAMTPTIVHHDGLGRAVAIERRLTSDASGALVHAEYDALGRVSAIVEDSKGRVAAARGVERAGVEVGMPLC